MARSSMRDLVSDLVRRVLTCVLILSSSSIFNGRQFLKGTNAQVLRDNSGEVLVLETIQAHLDNQTNVLLPPGYTSNSPVSVVSQVKVLGMDEFDEQLGLATFQMYFRLYWTDDRLDLPDLFSALPSWMTVEGIELRAMCDPYSWEIADLCKFWVPRITFKDLKSIDRQFFTIRLTPDGGMYISTQITLTALQHSLDFRKFPFDEHNLKLSWMPYGLSDSALSLLEPRSANMGGTLATLALPAYLHHRHATQQSSLIFVRFHAAHRVVH